MLIPSILQSSIENSKAREN